MVYGQQDQDKQQNTRVQNVVNLMGYVVQHLKKQELYVVHEIDAWYHPKTVSCITSLGQKLDAILEAMREQDNGPTWVLESLQYIGASDAVAQLPKGNALAGFSALASVENIDEAELVVRNIIRNCNEFGSAQDFYRAVTCIEEESHRLDPFEPILIMAGQKNSAENISRYLNDLFKDPPEKVRKQEVKDWWDRRTDAWDGFSKTAEKNVDQDQEISDQDIVNLKQLLENSPALTRRGITGISLGKFKPVGARAGVARAMIEAIEKIQKETIFPDGVDKNKLIAGVVKAIAQGAVERGNHFTRSNEANGIYEQIAQGNFSFDQDQPAARGGSIELR